MHKLMTMVTVLNLSFLLAGCNGNTATAPMAAGPAPAVNGTSSAPSAPVSTDTTSTGPQAPGSSSGLIGGDDTNVNVAGNTINLRIVNRNVNRTVVRRPVVIRRPIVVRAPIVVKPKRTVIRFAAAPAASRNVDLGAGDK